MNTKEPCSEDYQCGWNRGVADFQKNITSTITASEGRTGRAYAEFIEGYLASQENLLLQRADLRESGVLVIDLAMDAPAAFHAATCSLPFGKLSVRHLCLFSGGLVSWATAKRVVEKHGTDGVVLLFADTMMEDEDLYRFIVEAAANVGVPLTRIADGRNPWEVMRDERIIGGEMTGADPCSKILKRQLLDRWAKENCGPETVSYCGLDWTEEHRLVRMQKRMPERKWTAPMTEAPYLSKAEMIEWLKAEGIKAPRLYKMGFPHNNCGGFCIKAGKAHFALLLRTMPERYAYHEGKEEEMRLMLGKDYAVLREQTAGVKRPLTLRKLRERIESQSTFDAFDWGGCGCAIDAPQEENDQAHPQMPL